MKNALLLLCLLSSAAMAVEPGERLAPWTLLDQHERAYTLNNALRVLLVASDMDGATLLKAAMDERPDGYLEQRQAIFLADISRMPAPIARLFALPAMRDYGYRVLLDRRARIAPRYSPQAGSVLWLDLEDGHLQARRRFDDAAALSAALDQLQPQ